MNYREFLANKAQLTGDNGFRPDRLPPFLFDFQSHLVEWSLNTGRAAIFADCGMGKTAMELAWGDAIVRKENKPVILLTPLAVASQTVKEAEKFGIDAAKVTDGKIPRKTIIVTNYQKLHLFDPNDFAGCICDESSILKNFDGATKEQITEFMRKMKYRLLCTATAAPNDFIELGTSSEALGYMGYMDMLGKFFKNDQNSSHPNRRWAGGGKWRFRGHAQDKFWRWVCSWARAIRKPSDIGFRDDDFILPPLTIHQHVVQSREARDGWLFDLPAVTLQEQRDERARTVNERCQQVADIVNGKQDPSVCWCHLNVESKRLLEMIPDAIEVSGDDSDAKKEELFESFASGESRVLISKPKIAGLGLNWQHCAHQTFFQSHSFEQWYQSIRRCWRFGQRREVVIDVVTTEGEQKVLSNLQRKAEAAEEMFAQIVQNMNNSLHIGHVDKNNKKEEIPSWL